MMRFLVLAIAITGCTDTDPRDPDDPLAGGVLAKFRVNSEEFQIWVTNPSAITDLRALDDGRSQANIPIGTLLDGSGRADHNAPWSWHFDPATVEMAELTVEVCDAEPSYVEANRADFPQYCPWGAMLIDLHEH